jgi:hypothetical protein
MKNPGLPPDKFICDNVTRRTLLLEGCGVVASTGKIRKTFLCPVQDLSSFNQFSFTATNFTETILYIEMKLFHGSGKTDTIIEPVSSSGGLESLLPGKAMQLSFPFESFGTYGKPDGWKNIAHIEIICKREKTDLSTTPITMNMGPVYGEYRIIPQGPRLTDKGLETALKYRSSEETRLRLEKTGAGEHGDNLYGPEHALLLSIPSYHPYPHEKADEILKGRIMGEHIPLPVPWNEGLSGILEWLHFLHRHHFLREALRSFLNTNDGSYIRFLDDIIRDWIIHNPVPAGSNGGAGPSWETLSVAWRLREWLLVKGIAWSSGIFKVETKTIMLRSFWEHCCHLMDHKGHPNNWIIVESAALTLAGMYLTEFEEAGQWFEEGLRRLEKEFYRQFMADGVHFELSPLYHAICVHALLEIKQAASLKGALLPVMFDYPLEKAAGYLACLCRPDFTWPSLNDSGGITGDYCAIMELAGRLFNRKDFLWIGTRGQRGAPPAATVSVFPDAGIGIIRSGCHGNAHYLLFRSGPAGMTHVHEDVLSLDVAAYGIPCLTDPGITAYAPGPLTDYYRCALAHNMILIDGKGPARSKLGFQERVRSAEDKLFQFFPETDSEEQPLTVALTGVCNNYFDETGDRFTVKRTVVFPAWKYWIVMDSIEGSGLHTISVCWQFSPGKARIDPETSAIYFTNNSKGLALIPFFNKTLSNTISSLSLDDIIKMCPLSYYENSLQFEVIHSTGNTDPPCGWVSANGRDVPAHHFAFSFTCNLPLTLTWVLYPLCRI